MTKRRRTTSTIDRRRYLHGTPPSAFSETQTSASQTVVSCSPAFWCFLASDSRTSGSVSRLALHLSWDGAGLVLTRYTFLSSFAPVQTVRFLEKIEKNMRWECSERLWRFFSRVEFFMLECSRFFMFLFSVLK